MQVRIIEQGKPDTFQNIDAILPNEAELARWCECAEGLAHSTYIGDKECRCEVKKHHYHCSFCHKLTQIG